MMLPLARSREQGGRGQRGLRDRSRRRDSPAKPCGWSSLLAVRRGFDLRIGRLSPCREARAM